MSEGAAKPAANPWLIALVVTLAAFMEVLDTTIVNVALPHIAGSMSASNDDATWTLTSYLVANGIVLTISGWLGRKLGRKRYFLICIGMFTVCSLLCGLSQSLPQLIVCRLAQGFFGGGLQPNQQAIILDTFPPEKRGQAFAITAIATIVAPVLGPSLGGWITDNYSWRWIFFINVPVGALTFFGVTSLVQDIKEKKPKSIDYIGLSLIAIGLGCLQVMVDRGQDEDWFSSNFICIFAALAVVGILGAIAWLLYTPDPIVNIRVLKDRNLAVSSMLMVCMASILYASAVVLPQLAQAVLGYTATLAGLILSPGAFLIVLLIPLANKWQTVTPTKYVICFGFFCIGSAMVYSHGLTADIDFGTLTLMRAAQAGGLAFIFAPLTTVAFATIDPQDNGDATALFTMFRNVAGSIGISLSTAMITQRTQVRWAHLQSHLTPLDPGYSTLLAQVKAATANHGAAMGSSGSPTGIIYQTLRQQGSILGYMDIFAYCAIFAFIAMPLTLLLRSDIKAGGEAASMARLDMRLASLAVLVLGGCTLGPDFETPKVFQPDTWFQAPAKPEPAASQPVAEPVRADWWALLGDPELTALEQRAADGNLDVRAATLRLAESRAQRRIAAADEFPQVNGDASYVRQKPSPRGEFSLLGGSASGAGSQGATGAPSAGGIKPFNLWQYGFDASWELDLWGKVRRSVEAADANIDASAEARRDILLSTMAEVARDYVQLRDVQDQLHIAVSNRDIAEQALRLTRAQAAHGLASQLDADNAAAQLASVSATIPQLEQRQSAAINQLSFLMGEPPRALTAELASPRAVPPVPPQVPIGLPSELAKRRPDIREAEAKLHAATAEIGVAEASFYPSVTLSGSLDIQALNFNKLGSWAARTYSFGPSISVPIFEGGKLKGNLELTKAEQQEAAISFQKTVLNAWSEVDNALVAYDAEQRRDAQLRIQVEQSHQALSLAQQQYTRGETDYLHVLDTQRQVLQAEQAESDSRATISTNLVALYKSLGGGWDKDQNHT